ncbi:MAG: HAD family phosphatase [Ignisphaera sp.]|uniref:phosphoserine phosphatase n=1 Tax=Ignisphaera aggregans TaxID=334771 RepID=A0A7C4NNF0_9CREN
MNIYAFDVDGTLTPIKSSWWFAKVALGLDDRSRSYASYFFNGLISYEEWVFLELQLFKGLNVSTFKHIMKAIPWRYGIEELIDFRHSKPMDFFIAVTGGFGFLGKRAVDELGFDDYIGVELEVKDNILTGSPISYPDFHGKGTALLDYLYVRGIEFDKLLCIGDNVNDIDMFKCCDTSIAFCPSNGLSKNDVNVYIPSCNIRKLVNLLRTISR